MTVRNAHCMAYDRHRGVIVLFGGADASNVLGETWEWNGRRWNKVSDKGPTPRTFAAMAYDSKRQVVLLFGGNPVLFGPDKFEPKLFGDFWEWDGKRWSQLPPGPPARAEAALTFDPVRGHAILFGGYEWESHERKRLGDTWEWDGTRWTLASRSGPSPRNGASLVYDKRLERAVLFGGAPVTGGGIETWEWDGVSWQQSAAKAVEGRFNAAMTYDEGAERTIRFGGWNGHERTGDTWAYDGNAWIPLASTGPPPRNHSALAYDNRRNRDVLFGGHEGDLVFGDLWEWDGKQWIQRIVKPAQKRLENGH